LLFVKDHGSPSEGAAGAALCLPPSFEKTLTFPLGLGSTFSTKRRQLTHLRERYLGGTPKPKRQVLIWVRLFIDAMLNNEHQSIEATTDWHGLGNFVINHGRISTVSANRFHSLNLLAIALTLSTLIVGAAQAQTENFDKLYAPVAPPKSVDLGKVDLGKKLFFDARLSKSGFISCNSCH
jgi:hypothetical protein